jgi:hypothetical protein
VSDKPATYSAVSGAGVNRSGWHRQKKETRGLEGDEEFFAIAEVEALGFKGVKSWAQERGLLKEGRYTIAGRHKVKRMNYVDKDGLVEILKFFRARQGVGVLMEVEKELGKMGDLKEKQLKKVRALREAVLSEKVE